MAGDHRPGLSRSPCSHGRPAVHRVGCARAAGDDGPLRCGTSRPQHHRLRPRGDGDLQTSLYDDPPVCREMVRTLLQGHRYDGSRATRELGLEYTPVADTFRRTIDWAIAEGL